MTPEFPAHDFESFHRRELPQRLAAGNGALALPAARSLGPLAFQLPDGSAYTYAPGDDGIRILPGDAGAKTVVALDVESWQGLVNDLESAPGLLYAGRAGKVRGDLMRFVQWEPALRAMFHGIPVYDPAQVVLRDRHGVELDATRSFPADADREAMTDFLQAAGYLHVRQVFDGAEIAALRIGADELRAEARPGDHHSWWGRNTDGDAVLCRVIHAGSLPVFRAFHADPRVRALADLAPGGLVPHPAEDTDGVTVVWKNPAMSEGLSDLPWHRDCGMGGHAVICPTLVLSLYLHPATSETGELRFLPGSWRCTQGFAEATDAAAPQGIAVRCDPGDVTLHYGDVMHAAPPPTGSEAPFRSSVLIAFSRPGARHHRGEGHYNDVLLGRADGQVEHLAKVARRS